MYIVRYYFTAAIICLSIAFVSAHWYFSFIFAWVAMSLFCVSFAYIFDIPSVFRKKQNGSIPFLIKGLFLPFFIGAQAYNAWARRNDSVPAIQKISPNLYLACRLFPSDITYLKENGVSAILDATAEFDGLNWSADDNQLNYLNVPVLDHKSPSPEAIKKGVNWISHHINNNRGVVVHCAMGRGRSVLIVAAYLIASRQHNSVDAALNFINQSRRTANLNAKQRKALESMKALGALQHSESIVLIANPVSGGGAWQTHLKTIENLLSTQYQLIIRTTTKSLSAKQIALQYKDQTHTAIIACGGDGTVNEVAGALVNTNVSLGIIPLGTTNALSLVLYGMQTKLNPIESACEIIIEGKYTSIDTALCNDETMVLVAGLGFEQRMITLASREKKNESGEGAYIQALGSAIKDNENRCYELVINGGEKQSVEASSLVIANAAPMTSILAQGGDTPDPTDGQLDLTMLNTKDNIVLPIASLGLQGITKNWLKNQEIEGVEHQKIEELIIECDKQLDYVIDGEVRNAKRLHIRVNPSSLQVLHAALQA